MKQEESYTSKASFLDGDELPVWCSDDKMNYTFSEKRINRGQYQSLSGKCIHADINGALNILKKSNVVNLKEHLNIKNPYVLEVQKRKTAA